MTCPCGHQLSTRCIRCGGMEALGVVSRDNFMGESSVVPSVALTSWLWCSLSRRSSSFSLFRFWNSSLSPLSNSWRIISLSLSNYRSIELSSHAVAQRPSESKRFGEAMKTLFTAIFLSQCSTPIIEKALLGLGGFSF